MNSEIGKLMAERDALRAFAQELMECWPNGDIDGGALQDAAEKHGLLKPETRHEDCSGACGNACNCAGMYDAKEWEAGVTCYRKTELLLGEPCSQKQPTPSLRDYDSAQSLLRQHPDNMIVMDMDFLCWIRQGVRQNNLPLQAMGRNIAEISQEVFERLSSEMEQDWCSQFRQHS